MTVPVSPDGATTRTPHDAAPAAPARRAFVARTVATGAALSVGGTLAGAIALASGCGGGGGAESTASTSVSTNASSPPAPPTAPPTTPPDAGPVWQAVPDITFTEGVAASFPVAAFVADADGDPLAIVTNGVALPAGVTFDPVGKRFVYDGIGAAGGTSEVVLIADDGAG
jgi:hypothetical protein